MSSYHELDRGIWPLHKRQEHLEWLAEEEAKNPKLAAHQLRARQAYQDARNFFLPMPDEDILHSARAQLLGPWATPRARWTRDAEVAIAWHYVTGATGAPPIAEGMGNGGEFSVIGSIEAYVKARFVAAAADAGAVSSEGLFVSRFRWAGGVLFGKDWIDEWSDKDITQSLKLISMSNDDLSAMRLCTSYAMGAWGRPDINWRRFGPALTDLIAPSPLGPRERAIIRALRPGVLNVITRKRAITGAGGQVGSVVVPVETPPAPRRRDGRQRGVGTRTPALRALGRARLKYTKITGC